MAQNPYKKKPDAKEPTQLQKSSSDALHRQNSVQNGQPQSMHARAPHLQQPQNPAARIDDEQEQILRLQQDFDFII